ncbi:MAG: hypothetical protein GYA59_10310 [Chloroflexi bacterium]|nr:hypothetical protein [Chloroflexota bacterium]
MEKRYVALRTIGTIYKVLGIIAAIFTILAMLGICGTSVLGGAALDRLGHQFGNDSSFGGMFGGVFGGLLMSVVILLYGGGLAVTLYALGEGVYLLLALEENTRQTVALLQRPKED